MFDRIVQVCAGISPGDGISNIAVDYMRIFIENNIDSRIVAESVAPSYKIPCVYHIPSLENHITPHTLVIFHKTMVTDVSLRIINLPCQKVLLWHNITPPDFFKPYNDSMYDLAKRSIQEMVYLAHFIPNAWTNSEYSRNQLMKLGYKKVDVLHFPYDFSRFPDTKVRKNDMNTNILFVGRIAPNKRHEDIIRAFYYYHQLNPNSRLTLVGSFTGFENYKKECELLAKKLSVPVRFVGKVSTKKLASYYQQADLFLCMSEHEGLNIPLLEAMYFDVPVLAFASSSIKEGIGDAGIVFHKKHFPYVGHLMHTVLEDKALLSRMKEAGKQRVRYFDKEHNANRLLKLVESYATEFSIEEKK